MFGGVKFGITKIENVNKKSDINLTARLRFHPRPKVTGTSRCASALPSKTRFVINTISVIYKKVVYIHLTPTRKISFTF